MAIPIGAESGYAENAMRMVPVTHGQDLPTPETNLAAITYSIKIGENPLRQIRWASGDQNFFGGIFGRDSAIMIQHEVDHDPAFAKDALLVLASLQGTQFRAENEEEPGKILHEFRSTSLPGVELNDETKAIIAHLGPLFGGDANGFEAYVSADATGEWLKAAYRYLQRTHDWTILREPVWNKEGEKREFQDCLIDAATWIADTISYGPLHFNQEKKQLPADAPHLLGWKSITGNFITQQLCDSIEANHFPDGSLVNPDGVQYNTGMQGIAYDALMTAADIFPDHPQRQFWLDTALKLREDTLKYLLIPETNVFAVGADTNPQTGNIRRVDTQSITVADILGSRLLKDGTTPEQFERIISAHVRNFFGPDFWTPFGLRTESLAYWYLFEGEKTNGEPAILSPYHGPSSQWDVLNGKLADTLMHLGLPYLAQIIDDANHNGNAITGCHLELKHIGQHGELGVDTNGTWAGIKSDYVLYTTNQPERSHGWTITNARAQQTRQQERNRFVSSPDSWEHQLQETILADLRFRGKSPIRLATQKQIEEARKHVVLIPLQIEEGRHIQQAWKEKMKTNNPSELSAAKVS